MIKRIYQLDDLKESAELLRQGPSWWVHAVLFGLIVVLIAAVSIISGTLNARAKKHARPAATQTSVSRNAQPGQRLAALQDALNS